MSLQLESGSVWLCFNSLQKINILVNNVFVIFILRFFSISVKILKRLFCFYFCADITTCMTGVMLLVIYLASDSFTSTWQGKIFTQYQVTPMQMVFANSLLSSLLTSVSLYQVGSFKKTYTFIKEVFYY